MLGDSTICSINFQKVVAASATTTIADFATDFRVLYCALSYVPVLMFFVCVTLCQRWVGFFTFGWAVAVIVTPARALSITDQAAAVGANASTMLSHSTARKR